MENKKFSKSDKILLQKLFNLNLETLKHSKIGIRTLSIDNVTKKEHKNINFPEPCPKLFNKHSENREMEHWTSDIDISLLDPLPLPRPTIDAGGFFNCQGHFVPTNQTNIEKRLQNDLKINKLVKLKKQLNKKISELIKENKNLKI
jgi:hypothetical protein